MIKLRQQLAADWEPPVIMTGSHGADDIAILNEAISRHLAFVQKTKNEDDVRRIRREYHLKSLVMRSVASVLANDPARWDGSLRDAFDRVVESLKARDI